MRRLARQAEIAVVIALMLAALVYAVKGLFS